MTIQELDIIEPALTGAKIIQGKHPEIVFTSGRRTRVSQARAMASNVVINRNWILETYRPTVESRACQDWVDKNRTADYADTTIGLLGVLQGFSDEDLANWNHHLAGLAFDIQPVVLNADQIKADIKLLPNLNLFLEQEGGLTRWHVQFNPLTGG